MWPVAEVLRGDSVTAKYILEGRIGDLADYVATGERGMQTFDKHALELYHQGVLSGNPLHPERLDADLGVERCGPTLGRLVATLPGPAAAASSDALLPL